MKKGILVLVLALVLVLSGCQQEEDDNTLVVGIECAYAPFNWTTSESSEYSVQLDDSNLYCEGYDVDVALHLAEELGMDLVVKKIEWTGLIPALQSGVIDLIVAAMSPTVERSQSVLFTNEYYRVDTVMVVRTSSIYATATSLNDFNGANVIAQQDTIQNSIIDQIAGVNHMLPLGQTSELVISLTSSVSDAVVTELPVARAIVESNPSLSIIEFDQSSGFDIDESLVTVAVAIRLGETELAQNINDALSLLDESERQLLMDDASNRQPIGE